MGGDALSKGWILTTLGSVADFINGDRGANYPTQADRVSAGVPFINTGHIESNGRLSVASMDYITRDAFERLRGGNVKRGDILYCLRGSTIGKTARNTYDEGAIASSLVIVRAKAGVSQEYLYYFLVSPFGQRLVAQHDNGSAQPNLSVKALSRYPIALPTLEEQLRIARVLATLDEKIELNRRLCETLESMARALFKSWFVDFDPVRAKVEGRATGLPAEIAELFPDGFEESEVGEIPLGWRTGTLGDIAIHPRASVKPEEISSAAAYIALDHMPQRSISLGDWGRAEGIESNKHEFQRGDILFGKLRPYFHKVGVAPIDGVCSTDIVVMRPSAPHWFALVLGHASSAAFVNYTNSGSTGTKMPRTSWNEMSRYQLVVPPVEVSEALGALVRRYVDRIIAATHESRALMSLRDALLPRLLSGVYSSANSQ